MFSLRTWSMFFFIFDIKYCFVNFLVLCIGKSKKYSRSLYLNFCYLNILFQAWWGSNLMLKNQLVPDFWNLAIFSYTSSVFVIFLRMEFTLTSLLYLFYCKVASFYLVLNFRRVHLLVAVATVSTETSSAMVHQTVLMGLMKTLAIRIVIQTVHLPATLPYAFCPTVSVLKMAHLSQETLTRNRYLYPFWMSIDRFFELFCIWNCVWRKDDVFWKLRWTFFMGWIFE